ncbi:MAG: 16S rRNA (cytosine(1402)-N(4))-methyltransferase RsmH [Planctomycetota bacterium]|nr:16S rRNA (cytosine(1402)-N(4))-methyltransferase RsmH [Planctomycetota bacterium]
MNDAPGVEGFHPSVHIPVMLSEVLALLAPQPGEIVVDGTVGAGGHSREIIKKTGEPGRLIAVDRDPMMLKIARSVLPQENCEFHQGSYANLPAYLAELEIQQVDGILLDLGFSSDQLEDQSRGFRFDSPGPLDLRFDTEFGEPAWQYLQHVSEEELADVLWKYGEERFSREIASCLIRLRKTQTVVTAKEVVEAILHGVPTKFQHEARRHSATRVFQALRIAVNRELEQLEKSLTESFPSVLKPGGRLVIISFHSLEDRMVKTAFRDREQWTCLTPKPLTATPAEIRMNPRSRSAKIRGAVKL